jgi:hypothetical protein
MVKAPQPYPLHQARICLASNFVPKEVNAASSPARDHILQHHALQAL